VAINTPYNLNILPFNREEYKLWNPAVYDRKSRYVLSQTLLNEYRGGKKAEGTTDDLNIPFHAKNKEKAVPAFGPK
jgi:hypothetical protein